MARVRCWLAICRSNDFAKKSRSKSRNDFCVRRGKKISHVSSLLKNTLCFRNVFFFLVRHKYLSYETDEDFEWVLLLLLLFWREKKKKRKLVTFLLSKDILYFRNVFFFLVRRENICLMKLMKISNECYYHYPYFGERRKRNDQSLSKWIWILIDRVYINRSYYLVKQLNKKFPSNFPKKYHLSISSSLQFFHTC